jgi:hypothetical protein
MHELVYGSKSPRSRVHELVVKEVIELILLKFNYRVLITQEFFVIYITMQKTKSQLRAIAKKNSKPNLKESYKANPTVFGSTDFNSNLCFEKSAAPLSIDFRYLFTFVILKKMIVQYL